jgi:hypothetical protein
VKCPREYWRPIARSLVLFPRDAFDYVWVIRPPHYDRRLEKGLIPIWRDGDSALFKVDHAVAPAEPNALDLPTPIPEKAMPSDGTQITIRSDYLVGCDGGRSVTRKALGFRLEGDGSIAERNQIFFRSPDLFDKHGAMPMTSDMGDCLFTAMEIENSALAAPGYYAGMGFGVPGGIGVAAATKKRPLILVGDGAFQMTGWELGNCRRYKLEPIVILFNNASWEMLRVFQPESKFNNLDDWNFAVIAPSLGGHGVRVRTRKELADALDAAVKRRGVFSLIEVMLPRGKTSDTLARFVKGFKAAREKAASKRK